jgi:F-type H+-transporting ATPase subunit b
MEIVSTTELVSINATMLVQMGSFLIFLWVIARIMFRPLSRTMAERSDHLHRLEQALKTRQQELAAMTAALRQEEAAIKREAFRESEALEAAGKREAQAILHAVQDEVRTRQEAAAAEIRARIAALREELRRETEPLVAAILESLLGRRLNR